jgi:hypothetical protein
MKLAAAAAVACAVLATGCLWANPRSDSLEGFSARTTLAGDGRVEGGVADAEIGFAGVYLNTEAGIADSARDDGKRHGLGPYHTVGLGAALRGSLFGILGDDHVLDRYLDFGGELGGASEVATGVQGFRYGLASSMAAYYGVWAELGTVPVGAHDYIAITGDVRQVSFQEAHWVDQTQVTIGLAWRRREPNALHGASHLELRD